MKQVILIVAGFFALVFGGIGIFLPILPTTPFVLCAAGCFAASSPRLYRKLENTKYFGEYIRYYRDRTGISNRARWTAVIFLWASLIISALVFRSSGYVLVILAVVGTAVSIHILTIRRKES